MKVEVLMSSIWVATFKRNLLECWSNRFIQNVNVLSARLHDVMLQEFGNFL